jgi:ornithine cyclodeaminase
MGVSMQSIRFFSNTDVAAVLDYAGLIDALRSGLAHVGTAPARQAYALPEGQASLLTMPVWQQGQGIGVKLVTVFPENSGRDLPSVAAVFALFDDATGQPLALMEASELTARRTACTSALAADYLARRDALSLTIVGTGTLAAHMVRAHMAVRDYSRIEIWGRDYRKAEAMAKRLSDEGYPVSASDSLEQSVSHADVVTCVTTSREPLVRGAWLQPGCHLDLVGAFLPTMRETDSAAVALARVVVDTREGALEEAGDLLFALQEGAIQHSDLETELCHVLQGEGVRKNDQEITLFKSVGYAVEDLLAAQYILHNI